MIPGYRMSTISILEKNDHPKIGLYCIIHTYHIVLVNKRSTSHTIMLSGSRSIFITTVNSAIGVVSVTRQKYYVIVTQHYLLQKNEPTNITDRVADFSTLWNMICFLVVTQYVTFNIWINSLRPSDAYMACVSKLNIIGLDNGLSPGRHQAIIWTNAGILLIWPLRTNFGAMSIEIHTFSFKKMHLNMSSVKWQPFVDMTHLTHLTLNSRQHDGCWWPSDYLAPGHLHQSLQRRPVDRGTNVSWCIMVQQSRYILWNRKLNQDTCCHYI